jgi:hypothetical protein
MKKVSLALALLLAGTAGCAGQSAPTPATSARARPDAGPVNGVADGYVGRFQIAATVLENEHHGPELCVAVRDSYPPQCDGPDVSGWTWDNVTHQSAVRTRWGGYLITGTFDGRTFKLTEPAKVNDGSLGPEPRGPDFTSPCPAPAGGWKPVNPANATGNALQAAKVAVSAEPDFAGLWIDQGRPLNDPAKLVLNVRFTKDLARHEAAIRGVWGGALCVSEATHSLAELAQIQQELANEPGVIDASTDEVTGTVEIAVYVATQARQQELDAKYGGGLVKLVGALKPID